MKAKTPVSDQPGRARPRVYAPMTPGKPSRTQQSHKESCDMRFILRGVRERGVITHLSPKSPQYGNFLSSSDFHSAMNVLAAAKTVFEEVPAHIRARFKNDPAQYLDFVSDPANREEMVKLKISTDHFPPIPSKAQDEPKPDPKA